MIRHEARQVPSWLIFDVGQMKRFLTILLSAVLSCGFLVHTPEEQKKIERRVREWKKTVSARYDLDALTEFLKSTVSARKTWEGVDLTRPKIGAKWEFGGCCMNSGEWSFTAEDPSKDEFMLQFSHSEKKRAFALRCVRDGKKSFRVVGGFDWEVVELLL